MTTTIICAAGEHEVPMFVTPKPPPERASELEMLREALERAKSEIARLNEDRICDLCGREIEESAREHPDRRPGPPRGEDPVTTWWIEIDGEPWRGFDSAAEMDRWWRDHCHTPRPLEGRVALGTRFVGVGLSAQVAASWRRYTALPVEED